MSEDVLLSIDWDWITGDCAPGGQDACCGWCDDPLRPLNGRGIERRMMLGWDGRLQRVLDAVRHSANRQYIHRTSIKLWVAECHADILRIVSPGSMREIVHLDYHDDDDTWFQLCCGSWRTFLPKSVIVTRVLEPEADFHSVFVCLSSPWTPAGMDKEFWAMVKALSDLTMKPEFIGHRKNELRNAWLKYESPTVKET